jgi:ABC-type thiamine transport system ATPase subunit
LDATVTKDGCIKLHARITSLQAVGDMALGLDQISQVMGQSGLAAGILVNDLAGVSPPLRGLMWISSHHGAAPVDWR